MEEILFIEEGVKAMFGEDIVNVFWLSSMGGSRDSLRVSLGLGVYLSLLSEGLDHELEEDEEYQRR